VHSTPDRIGALALAVARIHRSRNVGELQHAFRASAEELLDADAYGMYLFDEAGRPDEVIAWHAPQPFIDGYEEFRARDPMFARVLRTRRFTHSLEVLGRREWLEHPLHRFMAAWGLHYSMEAPLTFDGKVRGTINLARRGDRYFDPAALERARFLCAEVDVAFQRIVEIARLRASSRTRSLTAVTAFDASPRARQVAELAASGFPNRAIAARLAISENTVRSHLKRAFRLLGVRNRTGLARLLYGSGDAVH
jgi:DNA-binding CsgD family transcriptional regulator